MDEYPAGSFLAGYFLLGYNVWWTNDIYGWGLHTKCKLMPLSWRLDRVRV